MKRFFIFTIFKNSARAQENYDSKFSDDHSSHEIFQFTNAFPETISLPELTSLPRGNYRRVRSVFNAKTRGTRYTVHRNYRASSRISFGEGALRNC